MPGFSSTISKLQKTKMLKFGLPPAAVNERPRVPLFCVVLPSTKLNLFGDCVMYTKVAKCSCCLTNLNNSAPLFMFNHSGKLITCTHKLNVVESEQEGFWGRVSGIRSDWLNYQSIILLIFEIVNWIRGL